MTVFSAAVLLFLVMDPFGNIPLFMSALKGVDRERHVRVIARELLIALAVLVVFLFAGNSLMRALRIGEPALTAAGGTVLLLIAIKMVFPQSGGLAAEVPAGEPLVVPMAIPYVAGPSAMAVVLLIISRDPGRWPEWLAAVSSAWLATSAILLAAAPLSRVLGKRGLIAVERLMGMLLVAVAIQMLMTGVAGFMTAGA